MCAIFNIFHQTRVTGFALSGTGSRIKKQTNKRSGGVVIATLTSIPVIVMKAGNNGTLVTSKCGKK